MNKMPRFLIPVMIGIAILIFLVFSQLDSAKDENSGDAGKQVETTSSEAKTTELATKTQAEEAEVAAKAKAEAAKVTAKAEAEAAELAAKAEAEAAELAAKAEAEAADVVAKVTATESTGDSSIPQYVVKDGMVDKGTYNGYRRFHGSCHACHGQDAAGGSFAPSLVESLKTVDYALFRKTVTEGRLTTSATGTASAMPAFSNDPNIMKHLDDIYRYLAARSDGVVGTGRPKKIPK